MGLFDGRRKKRVAHVSDANFDVDRFIGAAVQARSKEGITARRTLPPWQRQALEFYDLVGEAWYPAQFYARMLSRVRLHPAIRKGNNEVVELKDEQAQEILNRIQDEGGGSSQWKSSYGRLMFLIGDGYLCVSLNDDGEERWEFLSPAELVPTGDTRNGRATYTRKSGDGGQDKTLFEASDIDELGADEIRAWRMWRKHPTHSEMPDAPLRAVIGLLRVLMLLDKAAEAQAVSRIVGSGLLVVDDAITIPSADSEAADENAEDDPFMDLLTKYIVQPIGDPGSASAMAPLVARVETPEGKAIQDLIHLVQLHDPNQTADWHARIEKTITRIAIGLDMPPEEFLGLADANHWTGWVITEEKWKAHGEPVTIQLCDDITAAYYRQACIDAGIANAENIVCWYDPAHVVTHPDLGKSANEVHDRGELAGMALRRAHNFSESDAPSDEEREFYEAVKLKIPLRPKDPSEADASPTGADAPKGAPEENGGPRTNQPSPQPTGQDMRVIGAAELALERIRERAGSILRSKRMTCDGCFEGTETVPSAQLAVAVGAEIVRTLGIADESALVKGAADPFARTLMRWGVPEVKAKGLASRLERHAAETLYDETVSLPSDFVEAI